jgi:hypothetical protein
VTKAASRRATRPKLATTGIQSKLIIKLHKWIRFHTETESVRGLISFYAKPYQFRQIAPKLAPAVISLAVLDLNRDLGAARQGCPLLGVAVNICSHRVAHFDPSQTLDLVRSFGRSAPPLDIAPDKGRPDRIRHEALGCSIEFLRGWCRIVSTDNVLVLATR